MATVQECLDALRDMERRLTADPQAAARVGMDRTFVCHVTDLGVAFHNELRGGAMTGWADGDDPRAQIRLSVASNDLVALVSGDLSPTTALATKRLTIKASIGDLLRLRKLL
jgi:predicted lipid carrier protein YhbT